MFNFEVSFDRTSKIAKIRSRMFSFSLSLQISVLPIFKTFYLSQSAEIFEFFFVGYDFSTIATAAQPFFACFVKCFSATLRCSNFVYILRDIQHSNKTYFKPRAKIPLRKKVTQSQNQPLSGVRRSHFRLLHTSQLRSLIFPIVRSG